MKLDEYIAQLQKLREEHGADLEVMRGGGGPDRVFDSAVKAPLPRIAYLDTDHNKSFWTKLHFDKFRGQKVVRI